MHPSKHLLSWYHSGKQFVIVHFKCFVLYFRRVWSLPTESVSLTFSRLSLWRSSVYWVSSLEPGSVINEIVWMIKYWVSVRGVNKCWLNGNSSSPWWLSISSLWLMISGWSRSRWSPDYTRCGLSWLYNAEEEPSTKTVTCVQQPVKVTCEMLASVKEN